MFKAILGFVLALGVAVPANATHCVDQVRQRVVFNDHYDVHNVEYIVAVPHAKLVERVVFNDYDYQPVAVEKIVVRENVRRVQPVRVVEKVVQRNVNVRKRVRVRQNVKVQRVQKVRVERIVNGY